MQRHSFTKDTRNHPRTQRERLDRSVARSLQEHCRCCWLFQQRAAAPYKAAHSTSMQHPRSSNQSEKQSACDQWCWKQLAARPTRLLIAISILLLSSTLLYFASTSVELMQTVSKIADYSTVHPARPWKRKLIEKRLAAASAHYSKTIAVSSLRENPSPIDLIAQVASDEKTVVSQAETTPAAVGGIPPPIAYHDPDLSSCTHLSPQARTSFLQSARALRDPANNAQQQQHSSSSIPKQLLWNFGLWERSSGEEQSGSQMYESADGILLDSSHPFLTTLPCAVREVLTCWVASHPPSAGWKHLIWNRPSSLAFMRKYNSDLLPLYDSFTRIVQRSDLLRVLLVQQFGGIYLDVDVRAKQEPLESLWKEFATIPASSIPATPLTAASVSQPLAFFFEETILSPGEAQSAAIMYPIRKGQREECQRMANYLLASSAQHSIWVEVVRKIRERHALQITSDYDVLYTTGPALLTEVVYKALGALPPVNSDVQSCILASDYSLGSMSPPSADLQFLEARRSIRIVQRPHDQRWFDHMVKGTWRHAADRS